jgi:hypothetical protein
MSKNLDVFGHYIKSTRTIPIVRYWLFATHACNVGGSGGRRLVVAEFCSGAHQVRNVDQCIRTQHEG